MGGATVSTVVSEALCRVKVCPNPTDPWYHVCERCGSPAVHHHHKEPKGMGGSKERDVESNIVMLCHLHHEQAHGIGASSSGGKENGLVRSKEALPAEPGTSVRTVPAQEPPVRRHAGDASDGGLVKTPASRDATIATTVPSIAESLKPNGLESGVSE